MVSWSFAVIADALLRLLPLFWLHLMQSSLFSCGLAVHMCGPLSDTDPPRVLPPCHVSVSVAWLSSFAFTVFTSSSTQFLSLCSLSLLLPHDSLGLHLALVVLLACTSLSCSLSLLRKSFRDLTCLSRSTLLLSSPLSSLLSPLLLSTDHCSPCSSARSSAHSAPAFSSPLRASCALLSLARPPCSPWFALLSFIHHQDLLCSVFSLPFFIILCLPADLSAQHLLLTLGAGPSLPLPVLNLRKSIPLFRFVCAPFASPLTNSFSAPPSLSPLLQPPIQLHIDVTSFWPLLQFSSSPFIFCSTQPFASCCSTIFRHLSSLFNALDLSFSKRHKLSRLA